MDAVTVEFTVRFTGVETTVEDAMQDLHWYAKNCDISHVTSTNIYQENTNE